MTTTHHIQADKPLLVSSFLNAWENDEFYLTCRLVYRERLLEATFSTASSKMSVRYDHPKESLDAINGLDRFPLPGLTRKLKRLSEAKKPVALAAAVADIYKTAEVDAPGESGRQTVVKIASLLASIHGRTVIFSAAATPYGVPVVSADEDNRWSTASSAATACIHRYREVPPALASALKLEGWRRQYNPMSITIRPFMAVGKPSGKSTTTRLMALKSYQDLMAKLKLQKSADALLQLASGA